MSAVLVDPDLTGQATHGRAGFADYELTIASPELPCGVSWLASCLLELGLPLWRPWGIVDRDSWESVGRGRYRYRFPGSGWSRLVPGLVDGRVFALRPSPVPRFTHGWPGQLPATARLIQFVRDPRDALHSDWQRQRRIGALPPEVSFAAFVASAQPGLPLTRDAYLARHLLAWRASAAEHTLILRFEDAKAAPQRTLQRALGFIGLRAPARSIARAVRASDHAAVRQAEQRLLDVGIAPTPLLGRGQPYEYRERADATPLDAQLDVVCRWLGYAPLQASRPSAVVDPAALQRALLQPGCADAARLCRSLVAGVS